MNIERIGVVGHGEVGKTFSSGLKDRVKLTGAWDLKFAQAATRDAELAHA